MTGLRRTGALLVLLDLVTAGSLLWLTISDSWPAIGVTAALVAVRALHLLRMPLSGVPTAASAGRSG